MSEEIDAALAEVWAANVHLVEERLSALEALATALRVGQVDAGLQEASLESAHRLTGSLGMFGFRRGSEAAAILEEHFTNTVRPDPDLIDQQVQSIRADLSR